MAKQSFITFTEVGKKIAEVSVEISYRILELFSGNLLGLSLPAKV